MSGEAGFSPLTPESVRDESDPSVCEAQVAARQIVEEVIEAAREGKGIEALQEALEADPDHPGHLIRDAFSSKDAAKVAASIDRDEDGLVRPAAMRSMLEASGYAPADADLLVRAGEGETEVLEEISKDRDPDFDARAEALRKRMLEGVHIVAKERSA